VSTDVSSGHQVEIEVGFRVVVVVRVGVWLEAGSTLFSVGPEAGDYPTAEGLSLCTLLADSVVMGVERAHEWYGNGAEVDSRCVANKSLLITFCGALR
jgi:hypothetical protein